MRNEFRLLVAMALASSIASAASAGSVSGKVEILEKGGKLKSALGEVLVYIDGVQAAFPESLSKRPVVVTSHDKSFNPHAAVVRLGGTVSFPNLDDIMHNVFSLSKGNRFDLGLYKNGAKMDYVFENPGLVRVYCNIHPQMGAFIHVLENPYFAWVRPDGSFTIEAVPSGSYTLRAWHEEGEVAQPVAVTDSALSGVVLRIDASSYSERPHLNKFGKPYEKKRDKY